MKNYLGDHCHNRTEEPPQCDKKQNLLGDNGHNHPKNHQNVIKLPPGNDYLGDQVK